VVDWVARLCSVASMRATADLSISELFQVAAPELGDRAVFLSSTTRWLRDHPALVEDWQAYSDDRRASPAPYLHLEDPPTPHAVGFYKTDGAVDVAHYRDAAHACADYLYREACWILRREQVR